jgi:dihydrofolate reductase
LLIRFFAIYNIAESLDGFIAKEEGLLWIIMKQQNFISKTCKIY